MKKAEFTLCLSKFNSFFISKHKAELVWGLMHYTKQKISKKFPLTKHLGIFLFFLAIGMPPHQFSFLTRRTRMILFAVFLVIGVGGAGTGGESS